MSDESSDVDVNLPLTRAEALVLFKWLGNFNKHEHDFEDPAAKSPLGLGSHAGVATRWAIQS